MRLIFVNRFYWPETPATGQLLTDLAEFLAASGHNVEVICSHPDAATLPTTETRNGVSIHRVRSSRSTTGDLRGKAIDFGTFYLGALWRLLTSANRRTLVINMTDPPLLGIGAWVAAGLRRAQVIHWIQDIYPELAIELAGQTWLRLVQPLRDMAWRSAVSCVTIGREMAALLDSAGVPAGQRVVIENWAPVGLKPVARIDDTPARRALGVRGKFVVGYSGNLGRVHDLEPVLDIADALRTHEDVAFVFIGGGPQRGALEAETRRRGLSNVTFHPSRPRENLADTLTIADVHLVTLRAGCERLVFPSKLYGSAAVGRPILFLGPPGCEVAQVVRQHRMGYVASRDDTVSLAHAICRLKDEAETWQACADAAAQFAAQHSFSAAGARWSAVIDAISVAGSLTLHPSLTTE